MILWNKSKTGKVSDTWHELKITCGQYERANEDENLTSHIKVNQLLGGGGDVQWMMLPMDRKLWNNLGNAYTVISYTFAELNNKQYYIFSWKYGNECWNKAVFCLEVRNRIQACTSAIDRISFFLASSLLLLYLECLPVALYADRKQGAIRSVLHIQPTQVGKLMADMIHLL